MLWVFSVASAFIVQSISLRIHIPLLQRQRFFLRILTGCIQEHLNFFAVHTYQQLEGFIPVCPHPFQLIFRYMKSQNWLYNYRFNEGIYNSFAGLVRRARYMDDHEPAIRTFEKHYAELKNDYELFFPDVKHFARNELNLLLHS